MKQDLNKFIEATSKTNEVFIQRGYDPYSVDIGRYLLTGDTTSFTSTYNARELVKDINLEQLNEEIKISLIEEAIITLAEPERARTIHNNIPNVISNWTYKKLSDNKNQTTFDELYLQILKSNSLARYIGDSVTTAQIYYQSAEDELESEKNPNINQDKIDYLLKTREELLQRTNKKQR